MGDAQRAAIKHATIALPQVSLQDFSDDMMSLMAAADVVVAMGGYNTVCELLTLRKRAVVVPRVQPSHEQCIRAERMAAIGLLRMLHPNQLTPGALLDAVQAELAALALPTTHSRLKSLDGLKRTTAAIFELIDLRPVAPAAATRPAPPDPKSRPHRRNQHLTQGAPWHRHDSTAAAPSAY